MRRNVMSTTVMPAGPRTARMGSRYSPGPVPVRPMAQRTAPLRSKSRSVGSSELTTRTAPESVTRTSRMVANCAGVPQSLHPISPTRVRLGNCAVPRTARSDRRSGARANRMGNFRDGVRSTVGATGMDSTVACCDDDRCRRPDGAFAPGTGSRYGSRNSNRQP